MGNEKSKRILECAESYLRNAGRLIYSHGSKTFLSGYDLFDREHEQRGNIDCSTFVILCLSGIPYENSPYAKEDADEIILQPADWADPKIADFENLPDHYISIAERIGRPYLQGPRGLDLRKAETMGISVQTLKEEIEASGVVRRSVFIAEHYRKKGTCFSDPSCTMPGDLVFFLSKGFFKEGERIYSAEPEINHVGIIAAEKDQMIHSSGKGPAVSKVPVFGEREIAFFARP